jgi:hypothetical protein
LSFVDVIIPTKSRHYVVANIVWNNGAVLESGLSGFYPQIVERALSMKSLPHLRMLIHTQNHIRNGFCLHDTNQNEQKPLLFAQK